MIVDMILDRQDGFEYNAHDFYCYCMEESQYFHGIGDKITLAMDYGTERAVKQALCDYINEQGYNERICDYINSVNWLED